MSYDKWINKLWRKAYDTDQLCLSGHEDKTEESRLEYRKLLTEDYPHHYLRLLSEVENDE